jgi:hypothetical protein
MCCPQVFPPLIPFLPPTVWQYILNHAEDDDSELQTLFSHVLCSITRELLDTNMAIGSQTIQSATDTVKSFNKNELEEWETGVRNGVEFICKHKLKITKMKNIAPGRKLLHFQSVVLLDVPIINLPA